MKRREVSEPIYGTRVLFLTHCTEKAAEREAREWMNADAPLDTYDGAGITWRSGRGHFAVWIEKPNDIRTLVHEIMHVGIAVMAHVRIPINRDTEEALTYYCDWLTGEALKKR